MKKVCLVIGAGAGIGGSVGRKFAKEGYHAALCRRSDADGLNAMVEAIEANDYDKFISELDLEDVEWVRRLKYFFDFYNGLTFYFQSG